MNEKSTSCKNCKRTVKYTKRLKYFCNQKCSDQLRHKTNYKPKKEVVGEKRQCLFKDCIVFVHYYPEDLVNERNKFCSPQCYNGSMRTGRYKHCEICEVRYYSKLSEVGKRRHFTCGEECRRIRIIRNNIRKKRKNRIYTRVDKAKRDRLSQEAALWRKQVLERDNYTCVICHKSSGELHADHIKQFAFYPNLRFVLSNGRTLCKGCHRKTKTWGNSKRPT